MKAPTGKLINNLTQESLKNLTLALATNKFRSVEKIKIEGYKIIKASSIRTSTP